MDLPVSSGHQRNMISAAALHKSPFLASVQGYTSPETNVLSANEIKGSVRGLSEEKEWRKANCIKIAMPK